MKFCILRSGSSGNCTYIEQEETRVLLDAGGVSRRKLQSLLSEIGQDLSRIRALVITHLHTDHIGPLILRACRALGIPLWVHRDNQDELRRTALNLGIEHLDLHLFDGEPFTIDAITFRPFPLSHDARNVTSGFVFHPANHPGRSVAYAADLGVFDDSLIAHFRDAQAVVLESNHDNEMLWSNPRRHYLNKRRVAGDQGHLSNHQAGNALVQIMQTCVSLPRQVILCHLSADNNDPLRAVETVGGILRDNGVDLPICTALRDRRTAVFEL